MIRQAIAAAVLVLAVYAAPLAQLPCAQTALDDIDASIVTLGHNIDLLLARFNAIERTFRECEARDALPNLSTAEIVNGGYIEEGLWAFQSDMIWSKACGDGDPHETREFLEDMHYNADGLLVWDIGDALIKYHFVDLLAQRYLEAGEDGQYWINEYRITSATSTTIAGTYLGYWRGVRGKGCMAEGEFTGALADAEQSCLIFGQAAIHAIPSTRSRENGALAGQRRVINKVAGEEGIYWWQLSDDEFVREGAVSSSYSCYRL